MIERLTREQEEQIPFYIKKWISIASTPMNHKKAIEYTNKMYKEMGLDKPLIIFGFSPINTVLLCDLLFRLIKEDENLLNKMEIQVSNNISIQLSRKLSTQLSTQLYRQISTQLDSKIKSQIYEQLSTQLYGKLDIQLYEQLYSHLSSQISTQMSPQVYSQIASQISSQLYIKIDRQISSQLTSQLNSQLASKISNNIYDQTHGKIRDKLNNHISINLNSHLSSQIYRKICRKLYRQIEKQLYKQMENYTYGQLQSKINKHIYSNIDRPTKINEIQESIKLNWYLGTHWLSSCGWYDFCRSIGVNFDKDKYDLFINFSSEVNFIIPYEGVCFISEKPTAIHWKDDKLHKDGGLAVEYSDGYGIYSLNGVTVPEYLAITPEGDLDIEFFKEEKNADVKAEFIRKYGIDRMSNMGKSVDSYKNYDEFWWTKSEYELIDMSPIFSKITYAPHLRMKNLTTNIYHLEGVHPDCKTIKEALNFRWGGRKTENYNTISVK